MSNARKVLAVGLSVVLFAAAAIIAPTASAAAINFNDFSSVAGLSINGNASQVGNELQLTPAAFGQGGSAFSTTQVSFDQNASFSTQFDFRISGAGGAGGGADGLAFSLQTQGNNVGGSGGGLGYAGINDSLTIEFDSSEFVIRGSDATLGRSGRRGKSIGEVRKVLAGVKKRYPGKDAIILVPRAGVTVGELMFLVQAIRTDYPRIVLSLGQDVVI